MLGGVQGQYMPKKTAKYGIKIWAANSPGHDGWISGTYAKCSDQHKRPGDILISETHAIVSYLPKRSRNVLLMSTVHSDPALSERDDQKSQMILSYNSTKGGVDNLHKVLATLSFFIDINIIKNDSKY